MVRLSEASQAASSIEHRWHRFERASLADAFRIFQRFWTCGSVRCGPRMSYVLVEVAGRDRPSL